MPFHCLWTFSLFIIQMLWTQFSTYLHWLSRLCNLNLLHGFPDSTSRTEVQSPLLFLLTLNPKRFFGTLSPHWNVSPNNKFPRPAAKAVAQLCCFHKNSKYLISIYHGQKSISCKANVLKRNFFYSKHKECIHFPYEVSRFINESLLKQNKMTNDRLNTLMSSSTIVPTLNPLFPGYSSYPYG